jgi:hypothetical protein
MSASKLLSRNTWQRMADGAPMALTVSKVKGGIVQRMYLHGALIQKTFSKRPYELAQACDGTIDACVYGLLILFCRAHHLDLQQLMEEAYPNREPFTVEAQEADLQRALAQGIAIPQHWDSNAFAGLLDSLTAINNHSLVDCLTSLHGDQP